MRSSPVQVLAVVRGVSPLAGVEAGKAVLLKPKIEKSIKYFLKMIFIFKMITSLSWED